MLAAILLLTLAPAQPGAPFVFIQATDTQFGMYTGDKGFERETENFERLIATVNGLRPKFLIVTGDLVNKAGDPAQAAEYKRVAAMLDRSIPLYNVPGNHDVGNEPTAESLALYRKNFGRDYYTFRQGDMAGFVLNTPIIAHPESVPEELDAQEEWLRRELERARQDKVKHLIVFQHHPWFVESPDEADDYHNIPKARRGKYLDLLRTYGVKHVFAGHLHKEAVARSGGIEIIATAPTGKPLGKQGSGYRIVEIRGGEVTSSYEEFAPVPAAAAR